MADSDQVRCPHCGQTYFVQPGQWAQYHGRTINCTKCGRPFSVTAPAEVMGGAGAAPAQAPAPPDPGGMPAGVAPSYGQAFPPPPLYPPAGVPYAGAYPAGAGYPPGGFYPPPPGPVGTSGWAIASLILGILAFCLPVIGSLGAIGTAIGGLVQTRQRRTGGRGMAIAGLVLGLFTLVAVLPIQVAVLLPALNRAREQANRVKCAANMKQLGMSMMIYGQANGDKFPDKLEDLALMPSPPVSGAFVCPDDDKTPASGTAAQVAAGIGDGRHSTYVYVGRGLALAEPEGATTVLLYEPLGVHQREGMNVLFVDGHVEWLSADQAQTILDQAAKGGKPVRVGGDVGGGAGGK